MAVYTADFFGNICNSQRDNQKRVSVSNLPTHWLQVSVTTVIKLFQAIRNRVPARYLPILTCQIAHFVYCVGCWISWIEDSKTHCVTETCMRKNLCDLVQVDDESKATPTRFWRWLVRQKWRKMLPRPIQCFVFQYLLVSRVQNATILLRLVVVL